MPLSLNEIKSRALSFSKEWATASSERAESQSFWNGFFNVFGIDRRRVAVFEKSVRKNAKGSGFIDLLWKGVILIEHKSKGENLDKAYTQAIDYFPGLKENELPRYILVSDFEHFRLYDLEAGRDWHFTLSKLSDFIHLFGFISGYKRHEFKEQDPVNIDAARLMGSLHDKIKLVGYTGHKLELYLVRLLFCLFADSTGIFDKGIFREYIDLNTSDDGKNLGPILAELFEILDTDYPDRLKNLSESLTAFPYVNGKLFSERLQISAFDTEMRQILLDCCALDWSRISPAIFGSLFQSVMDETQRRNLGAHYTSEKNILKLIKPLFLDELTDEFERIQNEKPKLDQFHGKLSTLKILDPACGCGNFLIVAYREIRLLELKVLKAKFKNQIATHIDAYINVNVDQFYGIEYEEFPAQIAQVAMWLIDHQMNQLVSEAFGEYFVRLPLRKSATIVHGNSLTTDWQSLIPDDKARYSYILGNPPFLGYAWQSESQKKDMSLVFSGTDGAGVLDYVTCWYIRAAQYMDHFSNDDWGGFKTKCAFVSTNSISQGEQVGILWHELISKYHLRILFAHQTFKWRNEAKGNAGVHVVIIGFANFDSANKKIYEYLDIKGEPHEIIAKNINPYLVDAKDIFIQKRSKPLCPVPAISRGSDAIDDGNLLLSLEEKNELILKYPDCAKFLRSFLMGKEFLNNIPRFCLWLKDSLPSDIKAFPLIYDRVQRVKLFREKSKRPQTLKMAAYPYLFGEERQPSTNYLAIPKVSSESRLYIPIGFCTKDIICGDKLFYLPDAGLYHFGIITSLMHMTWMRYVCGRLESRYSYSNTIVYNNFPWPENPSDKNITALENAAQAVLDARSQFPDNSLADLYDPNTMPPALVKAHHVLDKVVDLCYRPQPFQNETKRIEFLFELYDKYTTAGQLFTVQSTLKKSRKK